MGGAPCGSALSGIRGRAGVAHHLGRAAAVSYTHLDVYKRQLYTTAFAGGVLILKNLDMRQKLDEWLFGSIVGMADSDLWIAFGISAIAVITLTTLQRPLLIYLFEPNIAASLGVPVRLLNYATFAVTILVLILSLIHI